MQAAFDMPRYNAARVMRLPDYGMYAGRSCEPGR